MKQLIISARMQGKKQLLNSLYGIQLIETKEECPVNWTPIKKENKQLSIEDIKKENKNG